VKSYSFLVVSGFLRNELNSCVLEKRPPFYEARSLFPFRDNCRCPFCESYGVLCGKCKAFRDVWKIAKSDYTFVMSVGLRFRPSAVPTGRIFIKFNSWEICRENSSLTNYGYFRCIPTHCYGKKNLAQFFLEWEMFWKICVENESTHFMFPKVV